jgi:protein O-mannosyl-transferase
MTELDTAAGRPAASWRAYLFLAALAICPYLVSLANGFVWDDDFIIVKNPATLHLSGLYDLLFSPDVVKPYYRPLNRASYLLNYWLSGMNPGSFHAVNLLLHLGNVLVLYLVALKISSRRTAPLVAAGLFALHPVNCEAVNFISGRNNLLALFFALASFWLFSKERQQTAPRVLAAALLFFLGLLSKETGLMVIVLVGFYCLLPLEGEERPARRWWFPASFVAATVVYLAMRSYSLQGVTGASGVADGLWSRLALNYEVIPRYLGLLLFPARLTVFQPLPNAASFSAPLFAVAWLAIAAALFFLLRWRNKGVHFGLLWFAVNYLPISNLVPIPSAPVAERYLYLPAVGLFIVAGEVAALVYERQGARRLLQGMALVVALLLAARTGQRNLQWRDDFTLFASAIANDSSSVKAHFNLGNVLKDRGDLPSAQREWETALQIDPTYPEPMVQLGTLAAVQGDFSNAERLYLAALRYQPANAMAHYNLGKIYELERAPAKAVEQFQSALSGMTVEYLEYQQDIRMRLARLQGS